SILEAVAAQGAKRLCKERAAPEDWAARETVPQGEAVGAANGVRKRSAAAPVLSREAVQARVLDAVRQILGSAEMDPAQPLMAAGLDSLESVELRDALSSAFAIKLPGTLVFDYPTVDALAGFLVDAAAGQAEGDGGTEVEDDDASPIALRPPASLADVQTKVLRVVAEVMGGAELDPAQPLMAAGLDSLEAVEL
ncbi:hypothetical protein H632_c5313p0, partial [Helicosporidium sp. ATCC 50920]